ncbi:DUF4418 family protein [Bifidobacterium samirii]|uniref:DUF4418 domain-containing protein n=1 Tax=Bifidobacterium samirii TaxID=2306974 RepID=A0A430FU15_9BIFI|nr:DUF4418 family protein [Bifidobacterium samirii]RSX56555.1 hypothetical protein D2E24_1100 [Bifidobacterium samirii]
MTRIPFTALPAVAFGALAAIAPQTFAHACQGHDTPGACHYAQQAATGIGVAMLAIGVIALFARPAMRAGLNAAAAVIALLLIAVPTVLIGVCPGAMMHCRMVMLPTLIVVGALAAICCLIAAWADLRADRADRARTALAAA